MGDGKIGTTKLYATLDNNGLVIAHEASSVIEKYKQVNGGVRPGYFLPISELEEVVEKLKNVEMQAAIQSSGWARMMSDELLSIITRLSTGRMDGGGEEG